MYTHEGKEFECAPEEHQKPETASEVAEQPDAVSEYWHGKRVSIQSKMRTADRKARGFVVAGGDRVKLEDMDEEQVKNYRAEQLIGTLARGAGITKEDAKARALKLGLVRETADGLEVVPASQR